MESDAIPAFIGPYHVGSLIIETDNSLLYESFHPLLCEKLALKLIRKTCANVQVVEDECSLMCEVSSDAVIRVLDIIDLPHYRCLVMPLATGGDLFEFVNLNGGMSEGAASQVIYTGLQALKHLHSLGIWHRDVKPENFLLMDDSIVNPHVVLGDLGSARRFYPGELATDFLGTPFYSAPEIHNHIPCMYF
jgi:serine/threonine protein kinase